MGENYIARPARPHERAVTQIIDWLRQTEEQLIGKEIMTFRGARGVVTELRLDNDHGLMFTFEPPDAIQKRYYPVSTIRRFPE
jgi:hypothetical protein